MANREIVVPLHWGLLEGDRITLYDRAHMATYLSLLHASGEGLTLDEMARDILCLDPNNDPDGARAITESHLARARWLATTGRRSLLESETDSPAER